VGRAGITHAALGERSLASGNQLQFSYGPLRHFRNLSPFKLTLWARKHPVLCADVLLILDSLMRQGYRTRLSAAELSFDVDNNLLSQFTDELCTRSRLLRDFKGPKGDRLYVGGVNSPWDVKFYERDDSIARIEFTLRSIFLRKHKIARVQELYLLRRVRLWDLISFRLVDQSQGDKLPPRIKVPWTKLGHGLPPQVPASIVLRELRESRIDPSRFVVPSPREFLLRQMQRNMIW
jgi:hypothetical protein